MSNFGFFSGNFDATFSSNNSTDNRESRKMYKLLAFNFSKFGFNIIYKNKFYLFKFWYLFIWAISAASGICMLKIFEKIKNRRRRQQQRRRQLRANASLRERRGRRLQPTEEKKEPPPRPPPIPGPLIVDARRVSKFFAKVIMIICKIILKKFKDHNWRIDNYNNNKSKWIGNKSINIGNFGSPRNAGNSIGTSTTHMQWGMCQFQQCWSHSKSKY